MVIFEKNRVYLLKWIVTMVHVKNYEIMSKKIWCIKKLSSLFFSGHGVRSRRSAPIPVGLSIRNVA